MKRLKFSDPLPDLILRREKDTTWRIGDEKNISPGDVLSLCRTDGREFARAVVLWVRETTFGELTEKDMEGHEKFSSREEMYETYSRYYNMKVGPETRVKVVKFKLLDG